MQVCITIKMDNAAFDYDAGGEVERIVAGVVPRISAAAERFRKGSAVAPIPLRDINGNSVGKAEVLP